MSSFTEELSFFERDFTENSYVFMDELFQSTNPDSGLALSKLFLEVFSKKSVFFICSSHYLNLLSMPDIQFFKMSAQFKAVPLDSVTQEINFKEEIKKPFELSLKYNLPLDIKTKIKTWIDNYKS
jgi:DNA mismatch repair ATPase MutS